ncbi:hypothetical protein [Sphingobium lactosutens]|uniref:Uncharacterized protein n=1 Tax=Sphingobium lactosutens DS20 TaxID=1331060 RepID=T0HKT1_9SPHN|nr:hypothetical protein [Sphingobium lactosutens]EQB16951.1 hypothetical protein RLDS_05815 [Sphingobium lactosutens DS20]
MQRVPDDFSQSQLQVLRLLVRFPLQEPENAKARNGAKRETQTSLLAYGEKSVLTINDISHFAGGKHRLNYRPGGPHGEKLHALYQLIWNFYRHRKNEDLRADTAPLLDMVYGKRGVSGAHHSHGLWDAASAELMEQSIVEGEKVGHWLAGCYRTYRRGTRHHPDGGELVMSPMRILPPDDVVEPYRFEVSYPPREEGYDPSEFGIVGQVIFSTPLTYLIGHDRGSGSPYLLILKTPRRRAVGHHGIALRSTTDGVAVSARVYLKPAGEDWNALRTQPHIHRVSSFREDQEIMDRDAILKYTSNEINNDNNLTLKRYEHGPDK